jgi:ComF family protein
VRQKLWTITQKCRLPKLCVLCNQYHKGSFAACTTCIQWLPKLNIPCQQCAYPLPDTHFLTCGHCIKNPPHFDRTYIAYPFVEPLRGLLHQFKYHQALYLTSLLCHLMQQTLTTTPAQCLIPVPLHPKRLRARGYNQAQLLGRTLAKHLNLPFEYKKCRKIINTAPQASLNGMERQKNIQNAFEVTSMPYEHVILIDDLLTTGATANELACTLKNIGVKRVDLWCCARTVLENTKV